MRISRVHNRGVWAAKVRVGLSVAAVATVAVLLLSCGGDDGDDDGAPLATAQPPSPTAGSPEPVVAGVRTSVVSTPTSSPEPTSTVAPLQTPPPEAAKGQELTGELEVTPDINGSTPSADEVSLEPPSETLTPVQVVKLLTPSVVHIGTEFVTMGMLNEPVPAQGVGTGIIIDESGVILTNNHVVTGAQRITVTLNTGEGFRAQVVGRDPSTDLAVIQIEASGLSPATLGDSQALKVGEDVIAIGHALGLRGGSTVSKGGG